MKIKINQSGYENFTSYLGTTEFIDGISAHDVLPRQINLLASIVCILNADTGEQIGPGHDFEMIKDTGAISEPTLYATAEDMKQELLPEIVQTVKRRYTREDLEEIADKKDINGLRDIAEPLSVKATSITKLIDDILKAG